MSFLFRSFSEMTVAAEVEAIIPTIEIDADLRENYAYLLLLQQ